MAIDDYELTDDAFLGGALQILQPKRGYRAGLDAVLAAAAIPCGRSTETLSILDAGAGVGVLGLCAARRIPHAQVTLVEIDPDLAALARQNVKRNELAGRVSVVTADIAKGGALFDPIRGQAELKPGTFQHVVSNPPFGIDGDGTSSPKALKARAHAMPRESLDAWVRFMTAACANGGMLTLIHRAEALPDLLAALDTRVGALEILPVHAREDDPAHRILIRGIKGSRAPLRLRPARVLHTSGHAFRPEIEAILRTGAPLTF